MVNHPNIVKFKDLKRTQNNYYLITEYVNGGSLLSNLKKYMSIHRKPFPEDIVQYLMKQIVSALNYLHLNRIIHRDLKLDN
jgi:serine/threonine protein kinase